MVLHICLDLRKCVVIRKKDIGCCCFAIELQRQGKEGKQNDNVLVVDISFFEKQTHSVFHTKR